MVCELRADGSLKCEVVKSNGSRIPLEKLLDDPVELTPLTNPKSGEPLEPAKEYGSTVLYAPYTGMAVVATMPEAANHVKPRFTEVEQRNIARSKAKIIQASNMVETNPSLDSLSRAWQLLRQAEADYGRGYQGVVGEAIKKDPMYRELMTATGSAGEFLRHAINAEGSQRQVFIDEAKLRLKSSKQIVQEVKT
jgi:hypothetical protein